MQIISAWAFESHTAHAVIFWRHRPVILDKSELCFGELTYENRLTAFFDILGWKNEIAEAGDDPRHIARLAAAVRMFNANAASIGDAGARLTTFSDNVVFSKPFAQGDVQWLLQSLATTQLGLAVQGFWMRGAVTVGPLYHDQNIVFGPALNRAHYLESNVARYPRILLDEPTLQIPTGTDFINRTETSFLDPFTPHFWDRIQAEVPIQESTLIRFSELSGLTIPLEPIRVPGHMALSSVANRLSHELMATSDQSVWIKTSSSGCP